MYLILLMILGWKEVHITDNYQKHLKLKNHIEENSYKTKSRTVSSRGSRGRDVVTSNVNNSMYYLYVKGDKYDEIEHII